MNFFSKTNWVLENLTDANAAKYHGFLCLAEIEQEAEVLKSEKKYVTLICNSNGQPWDLDGLDTKHHLDSEFSDTSYYDEESE